MPVQPGPVEQLIGKGVGYLTGASPAAAPAPVPEATPPPAAGALPSLDQLQGMTTQQVDALVNGLSDEQMRQLPPDVLDAMIQKLRTP